MTVIFFCVGLVLTGQAIVDGTKISEPFCPSDTGIQKRFLEQFAELASSVVTLQENFDMKMVELRTKQENLETERTAFIASLTSLADEVKNNITQKMNQIETEMDTKLETLVERVNIKVLEKMNEFEEKSKKTSSKLDTFIQTSNTEVQATITKMQARGHEYLAELENARNQLKSDTENLKVKLSEEMKTSITLTENRLEEQMSDLVSATQMKFNNLNRDVLTLANTSIAEMEKYAKGHLKPNVAFLAQGVSTSRPGRYSKLYFRTIQVNTNGVYSRYTGTFTAPIEGTYWFAVQICGEYNSYVSFRILVNGKMMSDSSNRNSDYGICTSSNTVAILKKGDKVNVSTGGNTYTEDKAINIGSNRWNMFMGALIN